MVESLLQTGIAAWGAFAVFLFIAVAGTVAVCSSLVTRALPSRVVAATEQLNDRVSEMERDALTLRNDWARTIEEMEVFERSIERKRKQIAGGVSRLQAAEGNLSAEPIDELAAIRSRVYGGRT